MFKTSFGISGYSKFVIEKLVSQIKSEASEPTPIGSKRKIKGSGPRKKPFLSWLNKKINKVKEQEKKKKIREKQEQERKKELLPIALQKIKDFQDLILNRTFIKNIDNELLQNNELLTEHCFTEFTKLKNEIDSLSKFTTTEFSKIACSATETKHKISVFNSNKDLIITIQRKKPVNSFLQIKEDKEVLNIKYVYDFRVQDFDSKIIELVEKANKKIYIKRLNKFLLEISGELDSAIKNIQKQFKKHWDKAYTLQSFDPTGFSFKILEKYGTKKFGFEELEDKIETREEFEKYLQSWVKEAKKYLSEPSILTDAVIVILQLINTSPQYGIRTYAMWLGNSKAKTLSTKKLDKKFRHKLQNYTIDQIAQQIENIIDYDWMEVKSIGFYNNPVLTLTGTGKKIITKLSKNDVQLEKEKSTSVIAESINPVELYPYPYLVEKIKNKDKIAWLDFLNASQNIVQIADWDQGQIKEISEALDNNMEGWKVLTKWKLIKHPIKYKLLERLL